MKVAIFIKNNELTALHEEKIRVVIFDMEKDKVFGVESTILDEQTKDSIAHGYMINISIKYIF